MNVLVLVCYTRERLGSEGTATVVILIVLPDWSLQVWGIAIMLALIVVMNVWYRTRDRSKDPPDVDEPYP